jgi:hypothetical protein
MPRRGRAASRPRGGSVPLRFGVSHGASRGPEGHREGGFTRRWHWLGLGGALLEAGASRMAATNSILGSRIIPRLSTDNPRKATIHCWSGVGFCTQSVQTEGHATFGDSPMARAAPPRFPALTPPSYCGSRPQAGSVRVHVDGIPTLGHEGAVPHLAFVPARQALRAALAPRADPRQDLNGTPRLPIGPGRPGIPRSPH